MIRSYLRGLAADIEGTDPVTLSEQLYLLFEGAITASQLHAEPWPAEYARRATEKLLTGPLLSLVHLRRETKCIAKPKWKLLAG